MEEIWEDIKGYEDLYQVSNLGVCRSLIDNHGRKRVKILSPDITRTNYHQVTLSSNKEGKRHLIHRLVAESFIINHKNKPQVNHINGDKANNCVSNLEWVTRSQNMKHAFYIGLAKPPNSKIVLDLSSGIFYDSAKEAAKLLGYNHSTLKSWLNGFRLNKTNLIYS